MMTSLVRRAMLVAGACTLTSAALVAQTHAQVAVDPRTIPELATEFSRASKLGLPDSALVLKAREGFLKQASPKVIRDAIHALADRMVVARDALTPVRSPAELAAGADALKIGVSPRTLKLMREAQKTRSIEIPIGVLTSLVSRGVPLSQAAAAVEHMLQHNVTETAMMAVADNVQSDLSAGVAPSVALDLRSRGVLSLPQSPLSGVSSASPRPPR
jgi:hypothetical protein